MYRMGMMSLILGDNAGVDSTRLAHMAGFGKQVAGLHEDVAGLHEEVAGLHNQAIKLR